MPGSYHIIRVNARPYTRSAPCYKGGRYHRHKTCKEEFLPTACGGAVESSKNASCNISIANPDWNYDWCHACVRAFPWNQDGVNGWRKRGIEALGSMDWAEWVKTPEGEYARPKFQTTNNSRG